MTITVLLADDHAIVRNGLAQLLATTDDMVLVGHAADGAEAVTLVDDLHPNVVLMDLSMPTMDGVEATRRITGENPSTRVLVLTSFGDQNRVMDALGAGAEGYLLKHSDPDEILTAIRSVHEGESPLDPKVAKVMLDARRPIQQEPLLTEREAEVVRLVRDGLANKAIARRLGISERTVKAHLTHVFQRIGVSDRTQAALWAQRHLDR